MPKIRKSLPGCLNRAQPRRAQLIASLAEARHEVAVLADTHDRLLEAEETLRAIRHGEVDALVVGGSAPGQQIFTLASADRPYRIFVENMREGAATLSSTGVILFANQRLSDMLGLPVGGLVAQPLTTFVAPAGRAELLAALEVNAQDATVEVRLLCNDGAEIEALVGVSRLDVDGEPLTCLTFTDLTSEHRLLDEVRGSQQRFEALYKGAPVPAYTWQDTPAGLVLVDFNRAALHLSGGKAATALGITADEYYEAEPQTLADMTRSLTQQVVVESDTLTQNSSSQADQHLHITMVPVPPDLLVVHTQDVTERWVAELSLRASEERYRSIVENAQEGISILDSAGRFTLVNRRTADLLGHDVKALTGMDAAALLGTPMTTSTSGANGKRQFEARCVRADGSCISLLVSTAPIVLAGSGDIGSLCMMSDVSVLRQAEADLAHFAMHDPLTGLPNRTLLIDRIDQAITRGLRQPGTIAALFCDLDDFKEVNDSFGHHIGDEVLKAVADRLRAAMRPADTVSRLGGDEFVILCEGLMDESTAFGLASRILESIKAPLEIAGHEFTLSVSVGVAFCLSGDAAELLRNADAAMYLAKQRGRNRAELFDERLRKIASERISLIADLRHAAERDELRVHFQPVFTLNGEQLLGVEALVRWQHPEKGLLFPDAFIGAAESANLIGEIGAWVLRASCQQAALWSRAGAGGAPLHMAVNVSARQLARGSGLVALVAAALEDSGIDPGSLVLEVTESAVMDDAEAALAILTELKALGVRLAIDDFGTGYSSLIYLKRFPVDQLKIDRAFVNGLDTDPDDSAIVASVVSLARAVGIVAIAEGVETLQQLEALQRLGCGFGQGYFWSRPKPAAEIDQLISSGAFAIPRVRTGEAPAGLLSTAVPS